MPPAPPTMVKPEAVIQLKTPEELEAWVSRDKTLLGESSVSVFWVDALMTS